MNLLKLSRNWNLNQKWITQVIIVIIVLFNFVYGGDVKVKTTKGDVKGKILKSRDGRPYYSFTGIPYAKPPIGELRLEAPVPVDPWFGTLDATSNSKICVQKSEINSQEDCLYLNVYTPSTNGNFPVMFWIHGGAFFMGHGGPETYNPEFFMDRNVVMVSINFRLGVLGFLSAEDDVIPGNYGMKDQVMALRWVQENIVEFGGDPGEVTIFGGSSGGVSVGLHLMSSMSKGLFHKAILQSGTPSCRWGTSLPGVARNRSAIVIAAAACTGNTSAEELKCLRTLPAKFFADLHERFFEWRTYPTVLFSPVIERCGSDRESFLCHHPLFEFHQESFVPAIIGLNSAEGAMIVASLFNETSLRYPEFYEDFNRLNAIIMSYPYFESDYNEVGKIIFDKYFPSGRIEEHSHSQVVKMITDGRYLQGILDMALRLSSPVYFYLYDYQNEFSFNSLFGDCKKPLGVTHGDELTSLFKLDSINPNKLNTIDTKVSKLMVDIWSKFATSETPTIDGAENGSAWPSFNSQKQIILHINTSGSNVIQNPFVENYVFWNNLPLLSNIKIMMVKGVPTSVHKKHEL